MNVWLKRSTFYSWLIAIICVASFLSFAHWDKQAVIKSDAKGYSAYLASWFIYHDLSFEFYEELDWDESQRYWANKHPNGERFPKYTMGVAMLQIPAFLVAHVTAPIFGFENNGWSVPYHLALGLNGVLMLLLGLMMTRKWLLRCFSSGVVNWSLFLILFATNLLYYGVIDTAMAHVYSFAMVAGMLWAYDQWRFTKKAGWLFASAAFFGFVVVIRPTNGLVLIIPIISFFANKDYKLITPLEFAAAGIIALLPVLPQLGHWYYMTGDWFYYSYEDEYIFWLNSHFIEGLFSWRNGWLVYTPIMLLSLVGLVMGLKRFKTLSSSILVMIIVNIYVVFAWWCWYYGDSYSIRPLIDFYPALAFGMAVFLDHIWKRSAFIKAPITVLVLLALSSNILMTKHYYNGAITGSTMTHRAFNMAFFNFDPPRNPELAGLLKSPDTDRLRLGLPERTAHDTILERTWKKELNAMVNKARPYGPSLNVMAHDFETTVDRIMHAQCTFITDDLASDDLHLVLTIDSDRGNHMYQTLNLRKLGFDAGREQTVNAFFEKPKNLPESAELKMYLWLQSGTSNTQVKSLELRQIDCPWNEPL